MCYPRYLLTIFAVFIFLAAPFLTACDPEESQVDHTDNPPAGAPPAGHPRVDSAQLRHAIHRGADYLVKMCDDNGKFIYRINLDPQILPEPQYNILRHCGTIYALATYGKYYDKNAARITCEKAVGFLKREAIGTVGAREDLLAVWSHPEISKSRNAVQAKLGGTGLGLVALLSVEDISPGQSSIADLRKMGDFILYMQKQDGSFYSKYYPGKNKGRDDSWTSLYYPGEAALGLLMLYEKDPRIEWLNAAARAIGYLARIRKDKPRVEPDHWAMLATAKLLPLLERCKEPVKRQDIIYHAVQVCEALMSNKRAYPVSSPRYGCFDPNGRTCPTATRLEGLLAAYTFLPDNPYQEFKARMMREIKKGINFLIHAQKKEGVHAGAMPHTVPGQTGEHPPYRKTSNERMTEVRIDYVQHALSAWIQYDRLITTAPGSKPSEEHRFEWSIRKKQHGATEPIVVNVTLDQFPVWLKRHYAGVKWEKHTRQNNLTRTILKRSLELGRQFIVNNQKPAGNFNYTYDFVNKVFHTGDNQVRQAGALWGLSLIFQYDQDRRTKKALDKALDFFFRHTKRGHYRDSLVVAYPGETVCQTGTVALVALSIVELLRAEKDSGITLGEMRRKKLVEHLNGYLNHLKFMRLNNMHFSRDYNLDKNTRASQYSPYFDGETMLCLVKAAKYLKYKDLIPLIEESSLVLAKSYTVDEWKKSPDSPMTKGFFQWSCMAFSEYQDAGWKNAEVFGDYVLALAWWMIHTHRTLERTKNTAYAYEGIIHAYRLAESRDDAAALHDLAYTIDKAMYKLTTWQVGGPLSFENALLRSHKTFDPLAIGGVMNHAGQPLLRIDVCQHQMHAVILALKYVYHERKNKRPIIDTGQQAMVPHITLNNPTLSLDR